MDIQKIAIEKLNSAKYNQRKDLKLGDPEFENKRYIETFAISNLLFGKKDRKYSRGPSKI